ncbi:MAG: hypothetical protein PHV06_00550 [bacterium]|nr:hypothetical protein [bacterium]
MEKQNLQPAPEPEKTTEDETTEESTSPKGYGKMDDDKFVEIVAFDVKMAELMSESKVEPLEYAKQREALLKKLGVTNENYEQYSEHLQTTDLEKYIGLIQKADEKAKEE